MEVGERFFLCPYVGCNLVKPVNPKEFWYIKLILQTDRDGSLTIDDTVVQTFIGRNIWLSFRSMKTTAKLLPKKLPIMYK
jgi:hypothetical protein